MANASPAVQYASVDDQSSPDTTTRHREKKDRCASRRFGVRVALIPVGYNGVELLVPFQRAARQKAWTVIYDVPLLTESIDDAAMRLFEEHAPNQQSSLFQVHCFGDPHFQRTRWFTILYSALVNLRLDQTNNPALKDWLPLERRPMLTRLEDQMVDAALQALQRKVRHEPIGIYMLPPQFTLLQLQKMYELLLGKQLPKTSFKKKMWESEILIPLEETVMEGGRSQPSGLYRFNKRKYYELKRKGFFLDL